MYSPSPPAQPRRSNPIAARPPATPSALVFFNRCNLVALILVVRQMSFRGDSLYDEKTALLSPRPLVTGRGAASPARREHRITIHETGFLWFSARCWCGVVFCGCLLHGRFALFLTLLAARCQIVAVSTFRGRAGDRSTTNSRSSRLPSYVPCLLLRTYIRTHKHTTPNTRTRTPLCRVCPSTVFGRRRTRSSTATRPFWPSCSEWDSTRNLLVIAEIFLKPFFLRNFVRNVSAQISVFWLWTIAALCLTLCDLQARR